MMESLGWVHSLFVATNKKLKKKLTRKRFSLQTEKPPHLRGLFIAKKNSKFYPLIFTNTPLISR